MNARAIGASSALPGFFKAACRTASGGGNYSYRDPGRMLSGALHQLSPADGDDDDWVEALRELEAAVCPQQDSLWQTAMGAGPDIDAVCSWFARLLPRCIALIPAKRKAQFVAGVREAFEAGEVEFEW